MIITCRDFIYLSREWKCEEYGCTPILQALALVPVLVTEPGTRVPVPHTGTSSGSGTVGKFGCGRVLILMSRSITRGMGNT